MPDDKDKEKQPWEKLGYDTFEAYNEAMNAKIDGVAEANTKLVLKFDEQAKVITSLTETKEEKKEEEVKETKMTEDDYKVKATTLFASLSDEQRKTAEDAIAKLPEEIQAVAKTSFEAKYTILQEMYPTSGEADDGSVFGALKKKAPAESPSDLIRKALADLKGVTPVKPERQGSGFDQNKHKADEKTEQKLFNPLEGLYLG